MKEKSTLKKLCFFMVFLLILQESTQTTEKIITDKNTQKQVKKYSIAHFDKHKTYLPILSDDYFDIYMPIHDDEYEWVLINAKEILTNQKIHPLNLSSENTTPLLQSSGEGSNDYLMNFEFHVDENLHYLFSEELIFGYRHI